MLSCSKGESVMIDNDRKIANEVFDRTIDSIQFENADILISLFSNEISRSVESIDQSISDLFDYFDGEVYSYDDWGGPCVSTLKEHNSTKQIMELTYDIKTTECEYRLAVQYVSKDTGNSDNIGIQSLYIIKKEDDVFQEYAYWGDGLFAPGIHIGIPNIE